jgi:hypothetical protein
VSTRGGRFGVRVAVGVAVGDIDIVGVGVADVGVYGVIEGVEVGDAVLLGV